MCLSVWGGGGAEGWRERVSYYAFCYSLYTWIKHVGIFCRPWTIQPIAVVINEIVPMTGR